MRPVMAIIAALLLALLLVKAGLRASDTIHAVQVQVENTQ